ncbi:MAG TPA: tetratricopeptide repeat protein [Sphingobacterium sp.]|nr:tetratricopeptide repeat protein [Sphingobacterium sp.]
MSIRLLAILLVAALLSSCSIFSSHEKKGTDQKYSFKQNLTSKYNILYNARLMLGNEQKDIAHSKNENYEMRLSVFDEPLANGDPHELMDSVIQKAYKIINEKPESEYLNEAYFIIGQANYLKGDFYTATEFFNVLTEPLDGQLEYLPLAYAWRSRAELQLGKIESAGFSVDSAFMYLDEDKDTRTFVNACKANYLLSTGEESEAVPYLVFALESVRNASLKNRWSFLLYQLYQEYGEHTLAYKGFQKLSKRNVPFDMAFEASLRAVELQVADSQPVEQKAAPLLKMLKEGKNEDYTDRILYKIGLLYMREGRHDEAFNYYNTSLQQERNSPYQTTQTYLTMADFYFEYEKYTEAQAYYDSVAMVLPEDYTNGDSLRRKLSYMTELTELYEDILWQDSLITIASLAGKEREKQLGAYAEKAWEARWTEWENNREKGKNVPKGQKKKSSPSNERQRTLFQQSRTVEPDHIKTDSRFYFNNENAMALGESDFKRKWGNRQYKEDWRYVADQSQKIKDKQEDDETDGYAEREPSGAPDEERIKTAEINRFEKAYPKNEIAYDSIYQIIHDDLIMIGNIYREYSKDIHAAIETHKIFLDRFPDSESRPEMLYSLFRMYEITNETAQANAIKQQLLRGYPTSVYALVAENPNHLEEQRRERALLDRAFEKVFALYASGEHNRVIKEVDKVLSGDFPSVSIAPQLRYLRALAVGRVERVHDFQNELKNIIQDYPADSLVTPLAKEHLAYIEDNPSLFVHRVNAIQDQDLERESFVDEPYMTPWPALYIQRDYRTGIAIAEDTPKKENEQGKEVSIEDEKTTEIADIEEIKQRKHQIEQKELASLEKEIKQLNRPTTPLKLAVESRDFADKQIFPDEAVYYFVVNVRDEKLNLASSRYGIGQFLRTRYRNQKLTHQLKEVNNENQLIYVGSFESLEEVRDFQKRIIPLIPDIMKVPEEVYGVFVITKDLFDTLTTGHRIDDYSDIYSIQ